MKLLALSFVVAIISAITAAWLFFNAPDVYSYGPSCNMCSDVVTIRNGVDYLPFYIATAITGVLIVLTIVLAVREKKKMA